MRATPQRVLFVADGQRVTAAQVQGGAQRVAAGLRAIGVRSRDVVSWQLPNWIEAIYLTFALDRIGAISNPILPIYRERELGFICSETGTRVLVVPGRLRGFDHRELAESVTRRATTLEHVLVVRADPVGPRQLSFAALSTTKPRAGDGPSPPGAHDVSSIFYTSGTTADPKGVLHTPSTLGALLAASRAVVAPDEEQVALLSYPVTHIGGIVFGVLQPVLDGSRVVFLEQFEPEQALGLIEGEGVTNAGAPPAILQALLRAASFSRARVRSVRVAGVGAAEVPPDLMRLLAVELGAFVYRSYGMTECSMATAGRPGDPAAKLVATDGRPVPGVTVRVVRVDGTIAAPGEEGAIELFGPQLCVGYVAPALTSDAFTADGFIRSGDLGVVDERGFLRITGRIKDIIIRKGENLSAKAIEDELHDHPNIADVAVIGVPDAESGERVCACVVPRSLDGPVLSLDDIRAFMRGRQVMAQKIPAQLELLDALPRNAMGKVLKYELRGRFGGGGRS